MGPVVRPLYNDNRGSLRAGPRINNPCETGRASVRPRREEEVKRREQRIEVVPVWRERVDRRLYVLALLALVDQLAGEAEAGDPNTTDTTTDDKEEAKRG